MTFSQLHKGLRTEGSREKVSEGQPLWHQRDLSSNRSHHKDSQLNHLQGHCGSSDALHAFLTTFSMEAFLP